jgi:DNA-binding CsgD family transcriptional regulator
MIAGSPDTVRALQGIVPPPEWLVHGLVDRRRQADLQVADWNEIFDAALVKRTAFYNDVVRPQRLLAPIHMMMDTGRGELPAVLAVYYSDETLADRYAEARKGILRLLYPAFRAGLTAFVEYRSRQAALRWVTDGAAFGIVFFGADGIAHRENEFFEQLMSADPDRSFVRIQIARIVRDLLDTANPARRSVAPSRTNTELRTRTARYRISATMLDHQWSHDSESVIALVERAESTVIGARALAERFSLTNREIEVAQLLRTGRSTRQIALDLGISVNTARRHIERLLAKLDVHTRTAAAAKLSGN